MALVRGNLRSSACYISGPYDLKPSTNELNWFMVQLPTQLLTVNIRQWHSQFATGPYPEPIDCTPYTASLSP
jgi:hypothetical protein